MPGRASSRAQTPRKLGLARTLALPDDLFALVSGAGSPPSSSPKHGYRKCIRAARASAGPIGEATHLRQVTRQQWRSGIAAWLGWTFDGLDMHLYTLVAAPFVAQLIGAASTTDPNVGHYGSLIQGAFLLGWALGGGFFGRIGDRLGRARALSLTVLTYAAFTGLSFFAQTWWHLMIFRFLAALGIGGEWAVGASSALGDLAAPVAAMDRGGAPDRRQRRHPRRGPGQFHPGRRAAAISVPGRRAAGAAGALDSPRGARNGGMAFRQRTGASSGAGRARPVPRRSAAHHDLGDAGLRRLPDRPLGLHVLASATPAQPARRVELDGRAEEQARQHGDVPGDRLLHPGKLLRRLAGAAGSVTGPPSAACFWFTSSSCWAPITSRATTRRCSAGSR